MAALVRNCSLNSDKTGMMLPIWHQQVPDGAVFTGLFTLSDEHLQI